MRQRKGEKKQRGKGQSVDALEVRAYLLSRRNVHTFLFLFLFLGPAFSVSQTYVPSLSLIPEYVQHRTHTGTHTRARVSRCQLHAFFPLAGFLREIKHGHKIKYAGNVYVREAHYQAIRSEHDSRARRKQTVQDERVNARTRERT